MLSGRTALVTGSTSGIGRGIAMKLAAQNANVIITGFGTDDEIAAVLAEVQAQGSGTAAFLPADMSKPNEIAELMAQAGPVDILVNNAGIQHVAPVGEFPTDKWDAIIAINLSSAFHTTHAALPQMVQNGWGRIINLASAHSLVASPYKSAYVAAKHGLAGFTKSVALECAAQGVTVNAVSPGYVLTPLVELQIPDTAASRGISEDAVIQDVMLANQPTKEFVGIDDVADTVVFLCSSAGKSITGANLSVDGGWTAQ